MSAGDYVVLWNGARDGRGAADGNGGYLCYEPPSPAPAMPPMEPELTRSGVAEGVVEALQREPMGVLCHELAQRLGSDSYRVGQVLYNLRRAGLVEVVPLARRVWTGHRFASYRYVWAGKGRAS